MPKENNELDIDLKEVLADSVREIFSTAFSRPVLGIKKLTETAIIPNYQTSGAAGFDLHADLRQEGEKTVLFAHDRILLKTGIAMEIPEGFEVQIRSRSGLAANYGLQAHFGTIDSDYKGEIGVILFNHSDKDFIINHNDRVAQAVFVPVFQPHIEEVETLSESERGTGGFGSTGLSSNKPL